MLRTSETESEKPCKTQPVVLHALSMSHNRLHPFSSFSIDSQFAGATRQGRYANGNHNGSRSGCAGTPQRGSIHRSRTRPRVEGGGSSSIEKELDPLQPSPFLVMVVGQPPLLPPPDGFESLPAGVGVGALSTSTEWDELPAAVGSWLATTAACRLTRIASATSTVKTRETAFLRIIENLLLVQWRARLVGRPADMHSSQPLWTRNSRSVIWNESVSVS